MKNFFLIIFLLAFCINKSYSQAIEADLLVNVEEAPECDTLGSAFYPYKLNITQDLDISQLSVDTIFLNLEVTGFFQTLRGSNTEFTELIPNMAVFAKRNNRYSKIDFSFDGINLTIPIKRYRDIRIVYGYYSDLCFRTHIPIKSCGLLQFDAADNSWYFTSKNFPIEFKSVEVKTLEKTQLFANTNILVDDKDLFSLDVANRKYDGMSLYIIDNKWYERYIVYVGDVKINLLLSKRGSTDKEDFQIDPLADLPNKEYIERCKSQIINFITSLNSLFPDSKIEEITILEDNFLSPDERYAYGKAVLMAENECFIFVDQSLWGKDLMHELVHCYMNYNYENIDARYFFDESLIEYIANYLCYSNSSERDHAFMDKIEYYLQLPVDNELSVFDITRNHVITETGGGTSGIIYHKIPFLIHQFAREIGEETLLDAVKSFNISVEKGRDVTFDDFGAILQNLGVSKKQWDDFKGRL